MAIMMRAATQHSRTNSPTWSVTLGAAIPTEPTHRATTTYPWAKSRRRPGPLQVDTVRRNWSPTVARPVTFFWIVMRADASATNVALSGALRTVVTLAGSSGALVSCGVGSVAGGVSVGAGVSVASGVGAGAGCAVGSGGGGVVSGDGVGDGDAEGWGVSAGGTVAADAPGAATRVSARAMTADAAAVAMPLRLRPAFRRTPRVERNITCGPRYARGRFDRDARFWGERTIDEIEICTDRIYGRAETVLSALSAPKHRKHSALPSNECSASGGRNVDRQRAGRWLGHPMKSCE